MPYPISAVRNKTVTARFLFPEESMFDHSIPAEGNPVDWNYGMRMSLGTYMQSSVPGLILGMLFYKPSTYSPDTDHIPEIWIGGVKQTIGISSFDPETAIGWQRVYFPTPVPISANTEFCVVYNGPAGSNTVLWQGTGTDISSHLSFSGSSFGSYSFNGTQPVHQQPFHFTADVIFRQTQ